MGYFEKYIKKQHSSKIIDDITPNDRGNVMVCCPFPHKEERLDDEWNNTIVDTFETEPNGMINLELRTFRCLICEKEMNENDFEELFKEEIETKETVKNFSKLDKNIKNSKFKTKLKSKLQIVAIAPTPFSTYESVEFEDKSASDIDNIVNKTVNHKDFIETKKWSLFGNNSGVLKLIEGKVEEKNIDVILGELCGIKDKKELKMYRIKKGRLQTVYKFAVTDVVTEMDDKYNETVIDLYAYEPLEVGKTYDMEYTLYPHPNDKQKIVIIALKIDLIENKFELNDENKQLLSVFQSIGSIENKMEELYQSARNHIAPYLDKKLWILIELVFNSPLDITYQKVIRGALDVFVLGDTRTGKSETSKMLRDLYDFGSIVNLKTSTIPALVGGSDDVTKTVKLGVLPRKHKELVVLEEFSGAPEGFIKTLTEIRSSCMVKISRVKADLQAPCKLRMITISNPISDTSGTVMLSSFPNGVEPINELIKASEDIARYDAFTLVPKVQSRVNPFDKSLDKKNMIPKKHYESKIKWIKTLTADNIVFSNQVGNYLFSKSEELNELFECSFSLFGSETDKKLARMTASLACMLCSSNDFKNIIITKEHIDFVFEFLKQNYDNELFRLRNYADEEKSYNVVVASDTKFLKMLTEKHGTLIGFIANNSRVSRNELQTVSGLNRDEFSIIFNKLASSKFIKISRDQVIPTIKFRESYKLVRK